MKTLKTLLIVAAVAAAANLTGCSSLEKFNDRGQALRAADQAAYETMTGEASYFSQNPQVNVHGS